MRLLICGDRNWTDGELIRTELAKRENIRLLVHGAARGADSLAGLAAVELGIRVKAVPANELMLKEKPHMVLAFHDQLEKSRGTKDILARARKVGIPFKVISHKRRNHDYHSRTIQERPTRKHATSRRINLGP